MIITTIEKEFLAQRYFEKCFVNWGYSICGIADFYKCLSDKGFYEDKQDEIIPEYKNLSLFHTINPPLKETRIKLIASTKEVFKKLGYIVDDSNILTSWAIKNI